MVGVTVIGCVEKPGSAVGKREVSENEKSADSGDAVVSYLRGRKKKRNVSKRRITFTGACETISAST